MKGPCKQVNTLNEQWSVTERRLKTEIFPVVWLV